MTHGSSSSQSHFPHSVADPTHCHSICQPRLDPKHCQLLPNNLQSGEVLITLVAGQGVPHLIRGPGGSVGGASYWSLSNRDMAQKCLHHLEVFTKKNVFTMNGICIFSTKMGLIMSRYFPNCFKKCENVPRPIPHSKMY